jgi:hypothetical protein
MGMTQQGGPGVLNPVGHVVLSFPTAMQAARAARALAGIGLNGDDVRRLSARQMQEQLDDALERAGPLAWHGEEFVVAHDHRLRAGRGCHWLVVRASNDGRAWQVTDCVRLLGAATSRYYSHRVVQELLDTGLARWRASVRRDRVGAAHATAAEGVDAQRAPALRLVDRIG